MCYRIVMIVLSFLILGGCNDEEIPTNIIKYTLEYDVKEGYPSISSSQHESGEVISLSTVEPKLNEHEFKGWLYKDRVYLPGEFFEVNNDVVLHAVWEPILYEISYYSEAYHDVPYNREYSPKGTTMKLSFNRPFKEGYTFHYWENNQNAYYPGEDYLVLCDTTFVAKWFINSYSLTYEENNGNLSPIDGGEHTYGSYVTVSSEVPIKQGYIFQCWFDNESGNSYEPNTKIQVIKDTILTAQWIEEHTLTYDSNNGNDLIVESINMALMCVFLLVNQLGMIIHFNIG